MFSLLSRHLSEGQVAKIRGALPKGIRMGNGRLVVLAWAVLFYGGFSLVIVYDQVKGLLS